MNDGRRLDVERGGREGAGEKVRGNEEGVEEKDEKNHSQYIKGYKCKREK